jgi:hypothetical protein
VRLLIVLGTDASDVPRRMVDELDGLAVERAKRLT